jgi:hypothetical protein
MPRSRMHGCLGAFSQGWLQPALLTMVTLHRCYWVRSTCSRRRLMSLGRLGRLRFWQYSLPKGFSVASYVTCRSLHEDINCALLKSFHSPLDYFYRAAARENSLDWVYSADEREWRRGIETTYLQKSHHETDRCPSRTLRGQDWP